MVPEDRAKIARVIYNRMGEDMRLDIDATVLYALGDDQRTLSAVRSRGRLAVQHPHLRGSPPDAHRRARPGLAGGGAGSEPGDWLYYVHRADNDGHHFFTDDQSEFEDAVAAAERNGLIS